MPDTFPCCFSKLKEDYVQKAGGSLIESLRWLPILLADSSNVLDKTEDVMVCHVGDEAAMKMAFKKKNAKLIKNVTKSPRIATRIIGNLKVADQRGIFDTILASI